MPDEVITQSDTPAPAPPASESVETLSASEQAVSKGFEAFSRERRKERFPSEPKDTKEPARVAAPTKPVENTDGDEDTSADPADPAARVATPQDKPKPRVLSKEQIHLNESIRRAVEPLHAEITRLKAGLPQPKAEPVTAAAVDAEPDASDATKYPDGQFDKKFIKDLSSWQTRQDIKQFQTQQDADRQRSTQIETFKAHAAQTRDTVQAAVKADPEFLASIDQTLLSLRPTLDLADGEAPTFGNTVADWIAHSAHPVELLKHLSNREEQHRLSNLHPIQFLREQGRIDASFEKADPPKETAPKEPTKPITQSPDPGKLLGSRPVDNPDAIESAVTNGDFSAYQRAKRQKGVQHYTG